MPSLDGLRRPQTVPEPPSEVLFPLEKTIRNFPNVEGELIGHSQIYSSDPRRIPGGLDVSAPVEDVLNKNPSLSLSGSSHNEPESGGRAVGFPLAPFGVPLGSLWPSFGIPLAILGHPLAPFGVPSGSL